MWWTALKIVSPRKIVVPEPDDDSRTLIGCLRRLGRPDGSRGFRNYMLDNFEFPGCERHSKQNPSSL